MASFTSIHCFYLLLYNKHTCREVRPIPDSPNLQVCLVFFTCHFGKKYWRICAYYIISFLDNEHFSRQHTTQTNKQTNLGLNCMKLKKFSTIFPFSWKEKMHTFCENIAKIYINLPVPNKFRLPSFFSSNLNTEYSIFIKQNKKIIITKQLKTVNLFFI
jgi:hypothetical protein